LRKDLINAARLLDARMLHIVGIPYAQLTRDWMIHERMRFLSDWAMRLPGRLRVLDAGCGSGLALTYLQKRCASKISYYAGLDLDTGRLRRRHRKAAIAHDFFDTNLDSQWRLGKFDLIFASEVLEHIVDDRRLFATLYEHLADRGVLVITAPNKSFVERVARTLPGFDAVSPAQDGGHVRPGYDSGDLLDLAREYPLVALAHEYLGRISMRELRKRDALRNHAEFANTVRFNPSWLLRHAFRRTSDTVREDRCWSLAFAFQNCAGASIPDAVANGVDRRSA
jgi:SAM-dependent methyltransferase